MNVYIKHSEWESLCSFKDNKIYRNDIESEYGLYKLNENELIINWEYWDEEIFYKIDDNTFYDLKLYNKYIINIIIINNTTYEKIKINTFNNTYIYNNIYKSYNYTLSNDVLILYNNNSIEEYINMYNNIYLKNKNDFFESYIIDNLSKKKIYL